MKIAFLTSFNSDMFKKDFERYLEKSNLKCDLFWNGYSLHEQLVFDENSRLYEFQPTLIFIHFEIESLLGDLAYDILSLKDKEREIKIEEAKIKLSAIVKKLTEKLTDSLIVIENFIPRSNSYLGVMDLNITCGLIEITNNLNYYLLSLRQEFQNKIIINPYSELISKYGVDNCFDLRLYHLAKFPFAKKFYLNIFEHYTDIIKVITSPRKKCIVCDLDNTLWGGIIGQDGIENIQLGGSGLGEAYVQFQKLLLNFYRRGIFLAVCSKNNYADAIDVIDNHPDMILRKKYFACIRINWDSKPLNIKSIADKLNIGTDSLVFIDDNPAECELVKMQMPEVEVVNLAGDPDNYIEQLMKINSLQSVFITGEDLSRNLMYMVDIKRKLEETTYGNLNDYFKSLNMRAEISINTESFFPRVSQLTQKTNQFNLTTKRYSNEEINKFVTSGNYNVYTLRLIDKYGDNGIVVVAIIEKENDQWYIDSFLMSCRVIGRQAETALLNTIIEDALKENVKMLRGNFIKSEKNAPAQEFYRMHNFIEKSNNYWELELPDQLKEHFIKIIRENHI